MTSHEPEPQWFDNSDIMVDSETWSQPIDSACPDCECCDTKSDSDSGSESGSGSSKPESEPKPPQQACRHFTFKGYCNWGDECKFAHVTKDKVRCFHDVAGRCTRANCAFSHDEAAPLVSHKCRKMKPVLIGFIPIYQNLPCGSTCFGSCCKECASSGSKAVLIDARVVEGLAAKIYAHGGQCDAAQVRAICGALTGV